MIFFRDNDSATPMSAANLNKINPGGVVRQSAGGGLFIDVAPMRVVTLDPWAVADYAGVTDQAISGSVTRAVYLDTSNALQIAASFPGTAHVPLAEVVTDGSGIVSITDKRIHGFLP